jgi:uncharacterized membrane protein YkoI
MKCKVTAVLLFMTLAHTPVKGHADERDHDTAKRLVDAGEIMPLETILKQNWRDEMGSIVEVELEQEDGRQFYEIEYLDRDGEAWKMLINARTGQLARQQPDD